MTSKLTYQELLERCRHLESALRISDGGELNAAVIAAMSDAILVADTEHRIIFANPAAGKLLRCSTGEILGRPVWELCTEDCQEELIKTLQHAAETGEVTVIEIEGRRADDTRIPVEVSINKRTDDDGRFIGLQGVVRDITERKLAQEQIAFQARTLNQIGDLITVTDMKGNILFVNQAACDMLQLPREQIIGRHVTTFGGKDAASSTVQQEIIDATLKDGHWRGEVANIAEDGEEHMLDCRTHLVRDAADHPVAMCGISTDITDRKKIIAALRDNETHLRTLIQTLPDLVWLKDPQGVYRFCNARFESFFGAKEKDIIGKTDYDFFDRELADHFRKHDAKAVKLGKPSMNEEEITFAKDGHKEILETIKTPIFDDRGNLAGVLGIGRDITDRKRMEDALEKRIIALTQPLDEVSEIQLEDLFNLEDLQTLQDEFAQATGVGSIITRPDGSPITRPSHFCRLCENIIRKTEKGRMNCFEFDAMLGQPHLNGPMIHACHGGGLFGAGASITVAGKHIANWLCGQVRDESQTDENIRHYAHIIGADEKDVIDAYRDVPAMSREHFESIAQMLYTLANQLSTTAYQNVQQARFIAEQKKIAEEISQSEIRFRELVDTINSGVAIYKVLHDGKTGEDYIIQDFNRTAMEWEGLPKSEVIGKSLADLRPNIDDYGILKVFREVWKTGKPGFYPAKEYVDGKFDNFYENRVFRLPNGEIVAIFDDVTERENTLLKIQEGQRLLNETEKIAKIGGWEMDMTQGGKATWTQGIYDIVGLKPTDPIPGYKEHISWYLPEYRNLVQETMKKLVETCEPMQYEARLKTKTGRIIWGQAFGEAVVENGELVKLRGTFQDITTRKEAEEKLAKANEQIRASVQGGNIGLWDWDFLTNQVQFSAKWKEQIGYAEDEIPDRFEEWENRIHPDDLQPTLDLIHHAIDEGVPWSSEFRFRHKDGSYRWILAQASLYFDDSGKPIRAMGSHVDITDRKQAEEELRKSRATYQTLVEGMPDIVMRFDPSGRPLFASSNIEEAIGIPVSEFVGKMPRELGFPEHLCKFWKNALQTVLDTQKPFQTEFSFEGVNGPLIHDWRLIPEFNEEHEIQSILSISRDITEHRRAEHDYQMLFTEMQNGFSLHEIVCNDQGQPIDYRFLTVNPAFERLTGLNAKDIVGKTVLEVLPKTEKHWIELYGKVALTGKPVTFENYSQELDRYFNITAFQPASMQFACIFEDITDRIKIQQAIEESERKYRHLFQNAPVGIFRTDSEGKVLSVNPAMAEILGFSSAEAAFRHYNDLGEELYVNPSKRKEVIQLLRQQRFVRDFEYEAYRLDGEKIWLRMNARIAEARPNGHFIIEGFSEDVTERKEAERQAALNQRRLESLVHILEADSENIQQFLDDALAEAVRLTESKIGFIYFYDEDTEEFRLNSWSKDVLPHCSLSEPQDIVQLNTTGLWGEAVRQRKPIIINDYQAPHPLKKGYPKGHAPLYKFMAVPVIIEGKIVALIAVGNKETDYDHSDVLQLTILMDSVWHMADRKKATQQALEEHKRAQQYLDIADVMLMSLDATGLVQLINPKGCKILGYTEEEILGKPWIETFVPKREHENIQEIAQQIFSGNLESVRYIENPVITKSGKERLIAWRNVFLQDEQGNITGTLSSGEDITERKEAEEHRERLEAQLRQAQKMEAVGQLAGGVAHDFNNLLQVILGFGEIAQSEIDPTNPAYKFVEQVMEAGHRAETLVAQLLAFSRQQVIQKENLNLNNVIQNLFKMTQRVIGEHINLKIIPGDNIETVYGDRGHIEQILMNLCINARDAMPEGGDLTIETRNAEFDEPFCQTHAWARPGRFVLLSVSDTGCGISEKNLENIFEPFYTTKEIGKGTGLGLATVYGLIEQHDGLLDVSSTVGKGTTFRIYLPVTEHPVFIEKHHEPQAVSGGTETILLAEDDKMVARICQDILKQAGYTVLTATNGPDAIILFEKNDDKIDMLILDMMMPGLTGKAVFERIDAIRPGVKCLFTSGYSSDSLNAEFLVEKNLQLLQKPYRRNELLRKVRELLDRK